MAIGYIKILFKQGIITEGDNKNSYMLNEFGKRNWKLQAISRYHPYETDINYAGKIYTFFQEFIDVTTRNISISSLQTAIIQVNNDNPKFENLNYNSGIYLEYNKEQFDLAIKSW